MIDISYDILFSVELLHKYSTDGACHDFTVIPSLQTQQMLNNYRMVVKQRDNILYAYTNVDPLQTAFKTPFIVPAEGLQLTFFLLLNNPLFLNYTSIPAANNNGNIYYFTNRNRNNSGGSKNFLTSPLPKYITGGTYTYEDLVVGSANAAFQSLSGSNSAGLNTASWRKLSLDRFLSVGDLLSWIPTVSLFPFPPGMSATPTVDVAVLGYDGTGNYTLPILTATINNPGSLPAFPLDLSVLESGKYGLSINGTVLEKPIYLNNELSNKRVFGVIDIFMESTLAPGYILLDQTPATINKLLAPKYSICFLNRATYWKYIFTSTNSSAAIAESTNTYLFAQPSTPTSPTTILSKSPIPLSERPLQLSLNGQDKPRPPCASADRLAIIKPDPVYYSEIFLNS